MGLACSNIIVIAVYAIVIFGFVQLAGEAFPDGTDVDAAGRVWNAEWGSRRVTACNPDGPLFAQIVLPVSQPADQQSVQHRSAPLASV